MHDARDVGWAPRAHLMARMWTASRGAGSANGGHGAPTLRLAYLAGPQNQSCQIGVTLPGSGGKASNSTRDSPGAWKSVPRDARKP